MTHLSTHASMAEATQREPELDTTPAPRPYLWQARRVIDRPDHTLTSGVLPTHAGERIPASAQQHLRGTCPKCRGPVVSNRYDCGGLRGYLFRYECWAALMPDTTDGPPACNWYAVP